MVEVVLGSTSTHTAVIAWPFIVFSLFIFMPARRAICAAFVLGWIFLPWAKYDIRFLPDVDKATMLCVPVLAAVAVFDLRTLLRFRPRWFDLPMLVLCSSPLATTLSNGLGVYDGLSWCLSTFFTWGIPYLLGRTHFGDLSGLRELAIALTLGVLVCMPLCWYEMRMSPQLHNTLYGYHVHKFHMTWRLGGYRPTLFFYHGIMTGLWMGAGTLCAFWLWRTKAVRKLVGIPMGYLVVLLVVTFALVRSLGTLITFSSVMVLLIPKHLIRPGLVAVVLAAMCIGYLGLRGSGIWDGLWLVEQMGKINSKRAGSLEGRITSENALTERALKRVGLGWGQWNRNRVPGAAGQKGGVTDSMWIIYYGQRGVVGLTAAVATLLLPAFLWWKRIPGKVDRHPGAAPAVAFMLILVLYMVQNLTDNMYTPYFLLAAGALTGLLGDKSSRKADGRQ